MRLPQQDGAFLLGNPKVHVHIADAREYLRTTKERFDIVFSEPSNPYRAGISSLYTVEYYRAAAERVAPGGIFSAWAIASANPENPSAK